jgi:hypothetical protein
VTQPVNVASAASMRELLSWLDERPRGYAETIEVWHSHCPRFTIWEDALADGLIRVESARVLVTPRGQALLG